MLSSLWRISRAVRQTAILVEITSRTSRNQILRIHQSNTISWLKNVTITSRHAENGQLLELRRKSYQASSQYHSAVQELVGAQSAGTFQKICPGILDTYHAAALKYESALVALIDHFEHAKVTHQHPAEIERALRFRDLLRREMGLVLGRHIAL
jgi:hypothetical protein